MNPLDTHTYDKKLIERNKNYNFIDPEKQKKIDMFSKLTKVIKNNNAIKAINLISRDIDCPANYDPTNDTKADILLYMICIELFKLTDKQSYRDILELLEIQLSDIVTSGSCPQGRCTRLSQIFFILKI